MKIPKARHYIHGDQWEGDPSRFYCSVCDVFFPEEHFFRKEEEFCCNHWNRYDNAIKMLGKSPENHLEFGRPINAVNIFTL